MMLDYTAFLDAKAQLGGMSGFEPLFMPSFLFDFQAAVTDWNIRKGRSATFADCGLGKTPMSLVWGENVVRHTNKPVLYLNPLAVSFQALTEAQKFDIEAHRPLDGVVKPGINVANYQRLHYFNPDDFGGVICGESSILKSFDGSTRLAVTEFMRKVQYRLLETATAAPNDYIELGTSSEALGELGYTDMLGRFFKNDQNTIKPMRFTGFGSPRASSPVGGEHTDKWRFKGHAEQDFWRWVSSWARAMRRPSDLGFSDERFVLPQLIERSHILDREDESAAWERGDLFSMPSVGLKEEREERRATIADRCDRVVSLVADTGKPALVWCDLNDEGDRLERDIPDAVQVSGKDSDEAKEEKLLAFSRNQARVLVTKKKIGAWGLNWQHCAHVTDFPSHSFEQYYQGVRRCWRFGQTQDVVVDRVLTESQKPIIENQERKAKAADRMFTELVTHMNDAIRIDPSSHFNTKETVPAWLS